MAKKLKKVFSLSLDPGYRNYTIRDIIDLKGKKKLTQICVNTAKEAAAAEEAGIDIILIRFCPEIESIRRAAPKTFMTASVPFIKYSDKRDAIKDCLEIISLGLDSLTCGSWNLNFMKYLNQFKILHLLECFQKPLNLRFFQCTYLTKPADFASRLTITVDV